MLKVNNRSSRERCKICSKLTLRHQDYVNDVILVSLLLTLNIFVLFLLMTLNMYMFAGRERMKALYGRLFGALIAHPQV